MVVAMKPTRREFLKTTTLAGAAALSSRSLSAAQTESGSRLQSRRLISGWQHYRGSLGGPWEVWHGETAGEPTRWTDAALPHCFNARDAVDPDEVYYRGQGWYRTKLAVANPFSGGRTLLHFEGAGQTTRVFVDLEQVSEHVGGYDEWNVDITEAVARSLGASKDASVPLAIVCDNSRDLERVPSDLSDFNLYGGVYRYLNLVYVPAVSIERVKITSVIQESGAANVVVTGRFHSPAAKTGEVMISVRVLDPSGESVHNSSHNSEVWNGERELARFAITQPKLWSPSHPHLYSCEVTLTSDHGKTVSTERFGLRRFEFVVHGPFKLNGERLLLKGTQRHEDHAGIGAAMTEDLIRQEMRLIKEMGANFIRLGHYQQSRIVLEQCDELGLLVWEEIPWCRSGTGNDRWKQQTTRMLGNMIDQHYNHPAIIIWGLGNENDWPGEFPSEDHEAIRGWLEQLNHQAHELDSTRVTGIRRCDFCREIPDVYSPSIWAGWYRGRYTEYRTSVEQEAAKVNHFLHIEWGGDSQARRHSEDPDRIIAKIATGSGTDERELEYMLSGGQTRASRDGDWSESYICNLFDWHLKEQESMPSLTGSAQWIFKDFSTPERPENPIPKVNQKGVVERDLTLKEGYFVFQSYWAEKPMVHIYGHSWAVRWGDRDEPKMFKVYSNCSEVELFVNGRSQGTRKRNPQDFPAGGLRWMAQLAPENQVRAVGRRSGQTVEDEISFRYETRKWGKPAQFQLHEIGRKGDIAMLQAELLDKSGIPCLDARNRVSFAVAGDGKLIDDLGTNTAARVVELCNGCALISIRRNGGKSQVSVSASDLPSAFLAVV